MADVAWVCAGLLLAVVAQFGWVRQARERERLRCQSELLAAGLAGRLEPATALLAADLLRAASSPGAPGDTGKEESDG